MRKLFWVKLKTYLVLSKIKNKTMKRAIYIGKQKNVGINSGIFLNYGITGEVIKNRFGWMFYPDGQGCPVIYVNKKDLYFQP